MRLLALAAVLLSLGLVAAGCGDDSDEASSVDEWADEFCTIVQDWTDELDRIGEDLGDVSELSSDAIEQAADDADAATQDFVDQVRDLGGPDTESGDAVEQELEELGDTVDAEREEIRQAVEDAEGLGGFAEAVGEVGSSLAAMASALEEALRSIDDADPGGEIRTAFEQSEACDEVTNSE
jgi:hypothetical protein